MTARAEQVLTEALSLPPSERAQLAERLFSSLDISQEELDRLWAQEADSRIDAYDRGDIKAISASDVFKDEVDFTIDTEDPVASLTYSGKTKVGGEISLVCDAKDSLSDIAKVEFFYGPSGSRAKLNKIKTVESGSGNLYKAIFIPAEEGLHFFESVAYDDAGNSKSSNIVQVVVGEGEVNPTNTPQSQDQPTSIQGSDDI